MPLSFYHSSQRSRSSGECHAFTITELFLCVFIVFVVCAVLFPMFAKVRTSSNRFWSSIAQKQMALSFLHYAQDYDDKFPPAVGYVVLSPGSEFSPAPKRIYAQSWGPDRILPDGTCVPGILSAYIPWDEASRNTAFLAKHPKPSGSEEDTREPIPPILEYMYNDLLVGQRIGALSQPDRTVLTIEAENRLANVGHAYTPNSGPYHAVFNARGSCDTGQGASIRSARKRSGGGAFVAFADGHVRHSGGGSNDPIFFPPRESASVSSVDPKTRQQIGPKPGGDMTFQGRSYLGTFHIH